MGDLDDLNAISCCNQGRFQRIAKENEMNVDVDDVANLDMISMDGNANNSCSFFGAKQIELTHKDANAQRLAAEIHKQIESEPILKLFEKKIKCKEDKMKIKRKPQS